MHVTDVAIPVLRMVGLSCSLLSLCGAAASRPDRRDRQSRRGPRGDRRHAIDVVQARHMYERWLILAVLTFVRIAVGFQFQSVSAVSHLLVERFHLGYAALGPLIGLYPLPGIAVALPGGVLAQRYGDKRIVCVGLVGMILGGALMALAGDLSQLLAGRVLSGAGAVLLNVVVSKMVTDWFEGRKAAFALGILVTSW